jgi:hypothetical protein
VNDFDTSPRTSQRAAGADRRDALPASLIVLAAQLLVAFVLYRSTLQLGFLSDAWVYLDHVRHGFWSSVTTAIGYHYQPFTVGWIWLVRAVFGENPAAFQAVNIVQVATLGFLTYQLGVRLLGAPGVSFLGSLLVIGNAAYYEASYWPLSGNCHILSGQLYVLAVIVATDVARGRFGRLGPWLLASCVLAAILTHPAMITAVVLGPLVIFFGGPKREEFGHALTRTIKAVWPLILVVGLIAITRLMFASAIALGPPPGLDWMRAYWLVTRGIVAVFSLRGSHDIVHRLTMLGTPDFDFASVTVRAFLLGWLVAYAVAGALAWRYTSTSGVRILILFLSVHLIGLTLGGGMAARQAHLLAVPAALLTIWALSAAAVRLSSIAGGATTRQVCAHLPAVGVLALVSWTVPDHLTSAKLCLEASTLARTLTARLTELAPQRLVLVNMPGLVVERGLGCFALRNGLHELSSFASPSLMSLQILNVPLPGEPALQVSGTRTTTIEALRQIVLDSTQVVVLFQAPGTFTRLTPDVLAEMTRGAQ